MFRIGIDVGGTFTDFVLLDANTGALSYFKVPSTPEDPALGIVAGLGEMLERFAVAPGDVGFLGHGTTVATNMMIERRGSPAGLVTTPGFRDVLAIGRQTRPSLYDYSISKPPPRRTLSAPGNRRAARRSGRRAANARRAPSLGINNRDLRTFEVDLETSLRLIPRVPPMGTAVAESGLSTPADLGRLRAIRCDAVLMGEVFMTSPDPAGTLATLAAAAKGMASRPVLAPAVTKTLRSRLLRIQ